MDDGFTFDGFSEGEFEVVDAEGMRDTLMGLVVRSREDLPHADNEMDRRRVEKLEALEQIFASVLVQTGEATDLAEAVRMVEEVKKRRG